MNPDTGQFFDYGQSMQSSRNPIGGAQVGSLLGQGLYGIFGHPGNPSKEANKYLNQVPGQLHPYYDPYVEAGRQALPTLQEQFSSLLNNPSDLLSSIGGNFQQSPGYQWNLDQAMQAQNNAAAAGGYVGTPQHQQQAATVASGLANQDYYNYIDRAMQNYMTGLEGTSGINQMGYGAGADLSQMLSSLLMNQGQLAYENQAAKNRKDESTWSGIGGALGGIASMLFRG